MGPIRNSVPCQKVASLHEPTGKSRDRVVEAKEIRVNALGRGVYTLSPTTMSPAPARNGEGGPVNTSTVKASEPKRNFSEIQVVS